MFRVSSFEFRESVLPKWSQPRFGLTLGSSAWPRQLDLAQSRRAFGGLLARKRIWPWSTCDARRCDRK
jgi:hypothetical protein